MSLYRRGRIWWLELPGPGGRLRRSTGTADRKEAQEYHEKVRGEIWRRDRLGEPPPVTWTAAVARWLAAKPRGLPDRYRIRALDVPEAATLPLEPALIERQLAGNAPATWNRGLALIVAIHNAAGVKPPRIARQSVPPGRTRWLSAEEWIRLRAALEATAPLLRQAAEFTLATGLRENNVLELTWDQVDLKRRVAWLHGDQMKGRTALGIPLTPAAIAVLAERRGIHKRWVFGNPDAPLSRASNRAWRDARATAGLHDLRWHDLRHTWASWAVMSGVRIEELQRLGGWKTLQMVQRYAHLAPDHLAAVAARVRPVSMRYNARRQGPKGTKTPQSGG